MPVLFDLPQTKGSFSLRGIVSGTDKDNFFNEGRTQKGKRKRTLKYDVFTDTDSKITCTIQGFSGNDVYFYSNKDKKTVKTRWEDRNTFHADGYRMLNSVLLGIEKDENHKNIKKTYHLYDAAAYASTQLVDGMGVYSRGNITYGTYNNTKYVRWEPTQISLLSNKLDMESEGFESDFTFEQWIVYTGMEKEVENDKPTGRIKLFGKIVGYNSIEDAEFIIEKDKVGLAKKIKRQIKPYTAFLLGGIVTRSVPTKTEPVEDDGWGDWSAIRKTTAPARTEFIVYAIDPSTIDTDTYTEEAINEALAAIKNDRESRNNFEDTKKKADEITEEEWEKVMSDDGDDDEDEWL